MIDFHCHLDLYQDPHHVLNEAVKRNCFVLAVTTTPLAWQGTCALIDDAPGVHLAAGLHPELAATRHREIDQLRALLSKAHYVGEIGLDGSRPHRSSLPLQREVFEEILGACETVGGRIMTIHSRQATSLVLDHLEIHRSSGLPVLHWFSGTPTELNRAIKLGCWFSVGPAMLRGARGRRLVASMPIDRVLTETDGPLAHLGSKALMPWDVKNAEREIGRLWKLSASAVQRQLSQNLDRVLSTRSDGNIQ